MGRCKGVVNVRMVTVYNCPHQELELKSLELERTRGGAGAPVLKRFPITMKRDDMGGNYVLVL